MSPSIKSTVTMALLASTVSGLSFTYPPTGLILADGDSVVASWDTNLSGQSAKMHLNCGKTADFGFRNTTDADIQIWTNVASSVTYLAKYNATYGNNQYCHVCASAGSGGQQCGNSFLVTPAKSAADHVPTVFSINGTVTSGSAASAPTASGSTKNGTTSVPGSGSGPNSTTTVPAAGGPTTGPTTTLKPTSGAEQLKMSVFMMGTLAVMAFVTL